MLLNLEYAIEIIQVRKCIYIQEQASKLGLTMWTRFINYHQQQNYCISNIRTALMEIKRNIKIA